MWRNSYAPLALIWWFFVVLSGCDGCSPQPPGEPSQASAALPSDAGAPGEEDPLFGVNSFLPVIRFTMEGEPDAHNRYPSVVRIRPRPMEFKAGLRHCSGVIIAPRLVLTAGHCVCWQRPVSAPAGALERRVESTACVETATVDLFLYEYAPHMPPEHIASHVSQRYEGRVRPHPRLEVRLDAEGGVLSSQADLAVIVLDAPVPVGFRPIPLAQRGVAFEQEVVMVGFAYDEELGLLHDTRLVHTSKVIAATDSGGERFRLQPATAHVFRGDSGGPCFREAPGSPLLIGISTTGLGHEPTMTALQGYWSWLLEEIRRVPGPTNP